MMYLFAGLLGGMIAGSILTTIIDKIRDKNRTFGYLKRKDDPEEFNPYLYLDLDRHPNEMRDYDKILFIVDFDDPQE